MVAFRFLYLGLLIGTTFALPVYTRSEFDDVYITLREPSGDNPEPPAPAAHEPVVNRLFPKQLLPADAYIYLQKVQNPKPPNHVSRTSPLSPE